MDGSYDALRDLVLLGFAITLLIIGNSGIKEFHCYDSDRSFDPEPLEGQYTFIPLIPKFAIPIYLS